MVANQRNPFITLCFEGIFHWCCDPRNCPIFRWFWGDVVAVAKRVTNSAVEAVFSTVSTSVVITVLTHIPNGDFWTVNPFMRPSVTVFGFALSCDLLCHRSSVLISITGRHRPTTLPTPLHSERSLRFTAPSYRCPQSLCVDKDVFSIGDSGQRYEHRWWGYFCRSVQQC